MNFNREDLLTARIYDHVAAKPMERRRTKKQIASDRAASMRRQHVADTAVRNLKYLALRIKAKQAEEAKNRKAEKKAKGSAEVEKIVVLPGIDDLIPAVSLHKINIR